jgi:peroxiredoxin
LEFPHLQTNYQKFREKGLEIVSINVSPRDTPEAIRKYWTDSKLTFTTVRDQPGEGGPQTMQAYKGRGCPTNYLVGKDGKVISNWVGFHPQNGAEHLKEKLAAAGFKE